MSGLTVTGDGIGAVTAWDLIGGYAIGRDLTRRDLQLKARDKGRPWDGGKVFDKSVACGLIRRASEIARLEFGAVTRSVNGKLRRNADLRKLNWSVSEMVSILSRAVRLRPGDLDYTGTPADVGALVPGDVWVVEIDGLGRLMTTVGPEATA